MSDYIWMPLPAEPNPESKWEELVPGTEENGGIRLMHRTKGEGQ
jgi:hypothetical protein